MSKLGIQNLDTFIQSMGSSPETPANVCTCIYHQNITLAIDSIYKLVQEIPLYSKIFTDEVCWYGNCDHDKCGFNSTCRIPENSDTPAKWMK